MISYCSNGHLLPGGKLGAFCPACFARRSTPAALRHIPGFQIESALDNNVYLATEPGNPLPLAIKFYPTITEHDKDYFLRQMPAASRLRHANIISIHRFGIEDDYAWFSMEAIDGASLADLFKKILRDKNQIPAEPILRDFARIFQCIAAALWYAHDRFLIHGNLKPTQIIIDFQGEVRIANIGTQRLLPRDCTGCTPSYIAPESGRDDLLQPAKLDIYSFGVLLHEFLTGLVPPWRPPAAWQLPRHIPREWAAVAMRCLQTNPADRYPTMLAVQEDLQRILTRYIATEKSWFRRLRSIR